MRVSRARRFVEIEFSDEAAMRQAKAAIVERFPRMYIDDNTVRRYSLYFPRHYLSKVRALIGACDVRVAPEEPRRPGQGVLPKYDDPEWLSRETERIQRANAELRRAD